MRKYEMEIIGYSERGMINSLFYEIQCSQNSLGLLNHFLSLVSFPYRRVNFQICDAKILIEQSFSDFGDADAVLLVDNGDKQAIFIEAKVKTSQKQAWTIKGEFTQFVDGIRKNKVSSSNLFAQLYFKVKLIEGLKSGDLKQLQKGTEFPTWSSKKCRKIGDNRTVLKAVKLLKPYCKNALFIAIVPDDTANLVDFYQNILRDFKPKQLKGWNIENWGYICWAHVEEFCRSHHLEMTLRNFEFNEEQIYKKGGNSR